jgi:hypothetical protein
MAYEFIQDVKVIVKGERIWWKPWKRYPDKEYFFPNVRISTEDFLNYSYFKDASVEFKDES